MKGLRFPHVEQGFRCERKAQLSNGKVRREVVFGVVSMGPDRADEKAVLRYLRGHWTVEALHYIRDWAWDEDRCRIRSGNGAQAMAALRNMAVALIKTFIPGTVAHGQRVLMLNHARLLQLVGA